MQRRWLMAFTFGLLVLFLSPKTAHLQDSGSIAFYADMDGDFDVYLLNLDDRQLINVSNNDDAYDGYQLAWSDDGRLAFISHNLPRDEMTLCVWSRGVLTCLPLMRHALNLEWSGDGRLAFSSITKVFVWDGVSDEAAEITAGEVDYISVVNWHPDGRLMYSAVLGNSEVGVFAWDGSQTTRLTDPPHPIGLDWSTDGRLVYIADQIVLEGYLGGGDVYVWDGERSINVTNTGDPDDPDQPSYRNPAWGVDGRLAFVMSLDDYAGSVLVWDGDTLTNITNDQAQGYDTLVWSPDGRLAFTARPEQGGQVLYVSDDGAQTLIHETRGMIGDLGWHKDGQRLLFTADDGQGSRQIYLWDGTVVEQLTDDSGIQHYGAVWVP